MTESPINPLEPVFQRELSARLNAAQRALEGGDFARLRLELRRSRVAARAAGASVEGFLAQLEGHFDSPAQLNSLEPQSDLERSWLELVRVAAVGTLVRAAFAAEQSTRQQRLRHALEPASRQLEFARLRRAARAAGVALEEPEQGRTAPEKPVPVNPPAVRANPERRINPDATQGDSSVRVAVAKLDALLSLSGELTVSRIRFASRTRELRESLRDLGSARRGAKKQNANPAVQLERLEFQLKETLDRLSALERQLARDNAQLQTLTEGLEDEVLGARLLPAGLLLPPLERLVRDLSQQLGKRVRFVTRGSDVEMDRKIIEGIRDPLMHMIRNALDHGLEGPEQRIRNGKSPEGTIDLAMLSSGGTVTLELSDDGAGINTAGVLRRASERGLLTENQAVEGGSARALELIFEPGFSTAASVTDTSGRGVGMDVVRENIRALGGTVVVQSTSGHGSRFTLRVPAQLATTRVLLLRVGAQTVAVPTADVERTGRVRASDIGSVGGRQTVHIAGRAVPLVELGGLLEMNFNALESWQPYAVLRHQEGRLACTVDALLIEQEVVVKRLGYPLGAAPHIAGAAVLGSGDLVPILTVSALFARHEGSAGSGNRRATRVAVAPVKRHSILVVDDSLTTRTLERSILDAAGFDTRVAVDGRQALELLRRAPADLVLSDVEMPELDGFGLTTEIRRDPKLAHIPVILVTSLDQPEHKERGALAGADAYIVKGEFDQAVLLETIGRLL